MDSEALLTIPYLLETHPNWNHQTKSYKKPVLQADLCSPGFC